ncbi:MAG: kanF [Frankiales bacterium]|nr:kanF [Frankiales bacterium]
MDPSPLASLAPVTRVAHVITRMIVGGAQETVLLAAALARQVDPVVLTGPQTGPEGSLLGQCRERGVEVVLVPELVREVDPRRDLASVPALVRALRGTGADLVHTHSSKAGVVGRVAARRAGLPAVHTVHGWPFHDHQRASVRRLWQGVERACAPLARRLVVVAEADRDKGLAAGIGRPEQYATVRSGLELDLYGPSALDRAAVREELGLPPEAVVIGAVNRLSPQKDPLTLLRAVGPLLAARPELRLLLVGDGPLRAEVERLAGPQVVLTGLRTDVPRLLRAMDVFVTASLWEGLPRTVLQAVATGLPVVATAADGVVDVVVEGRTGLLAPPGDAQELGAQLARLLDDPVLGERLTAAAATRLPEFDAHRMVARLEDLYEQVLQA